MQEQGLANKTVCGDSMGEGKEEGGDICERGHMCEMVCMQDSAHVRWCEGDGQGGGEG